jgi:hypothetical protein
MTHPAQTPLRTSLLVGAIPIAVLVFFYAFVVAVRFVLGHWPAYGRPDPALLPPWLVPVEVTVMLLLLGVAASPVIALPLLAASLHERLRRVRRPLGVYLLAWCVAVAIAWADPGGFFDWLLD